MLRLGKRHVTKKLSGYRGRGKTGEGTMRRCERCEVMNLILFPSTEPDACNVNVPLNNQTHDCHCTDFCATPSCALSRALVLLLLLPHLL
jgi:hypothetical protein